MPEAGAGLGRFREGLAAGLLRRAHAEGAAMSEDEENRGRRKEDGKDPWYVDKRIPLGLILAFLFQGSAIIWYAASQSAKVDDHERRIVIQETALVGPSGISERLTRVEEKQSAAQKSLDRIETIVAAPPGTPERSRR
jgi:hypothetical protein